MMGFELPEVSLVVFQYFHHRGLFELCFFLFWSLLSRDL